VSAADNGNGRARGFLKRRFLPPERRREVSREIEEMSSAGISYYVMVAISTIIAAYGLLANSTAVVIGAMLVAPLMGPIFGIALGLLVGDSRLAWRAALAEVAGVVLAVALATLIGLVPWRLEFGVEILARTHPTLYDIIVAVAAGAAGAYALTNERVSPSLPGVAIAVAVVPPLAACGLCIASAQWHLAGGAILLFLANLLAIEIAAAVVFTYFGMVEVPTRQAVTFGDFLREFAVSLIALAVIAAFMTRTLATEIGSQRYQTYVRTALNKQILTTSGARLTDIEFQDDVGSRRVFATVFTPTAFTPPQVAAMEAALESSVDPRIDLTVRSLISRDTDRDGAVFVVEQQQSRDEQAEADARFFARLKTALAEQLDSTPGARLESVNWQDGDGAITVMAEVSTPVSIEPARVATMQEGLAEATGRDLRLIVRSTIAHDADADHYLYQPEAENARELTPAQMHLYDRLWGAMRNQLALEIESTRPEKIQYIEQEGRISVLVIARGPAALTPTQVGRMQANLRKHVDPTIDLVVRSRFGVDAAADGYLGPDAPDRTLIELDAME